MKEHFRVNPGDRIDVCSMRLARVQTLPALLGVASTRWLPPLARLAGDSAVVGWGLKPSGVRAQTLAARSGASLFLLEDGFLRSVGLGVQGDPALSIVLDNTGVYYDATCASRLETMLVDGHDAGMFGDGVSALSDCWERAAQCIDRIVTARLSKYNFSPEVDLAPTEHPRVLVVDQTAGDMSIELGLADAASFERMLDAAVAENPEAEILVKVHPDVIVGKKKGHLLEVARQRRLTLLAESMNPIRLLEQVDRVYVVTSQLGFEALMVGKPVFCFGAPFYAGWGLTDDRVAIPRRGVARTLEEVFAAAYILYPRYVDPATGQRCEIETVIDYLAIQRYWHERNRGRLFCVGFRPWKRQFVRTFLAGPDNQIEFVRSASQARRKGFDADARLVVWGEREPADIRALAHEHGVAIERMEDGFLRSSGLGSDFTAPLSLVVDGRGMYYDPRQPSDLEHLLTTADIDETLCVRARDLRQRIVQLGVSKYNFGPQDELDIAPQPGQRVVLVPGQVEDDISIRLGCPGPCTNRALLETVRAAWPGVYVIYKPHPEVLSGNRKGGVVLNPEEHLWDAVADNVSVDACLAVADEVHTLTSLVGFEALMRQLPVMVYGQPFYAGWGLTEDIYPVQRRQAYRRLTLDELVAATLILYPRYVDPKTNGFTTAEVVVDRLQEQVGRSVLARRLNQPWIVRQARKLWRLAVGVGYAR